jgi:hypothetical protein
MEDPKDTPGVKAIRVELKNRAIRVLSNLYDVLLRNGDFDVDILVRPVIDFRPSKSAWGTWNPEDNSIILNERLIWEAPWSAVEGIFAHEVAHKIVDEVFMALPIFSEEDGPHGNTFKMVCGFLHLDSFFTRAGIDLFDSEGAPPSPFGKKRKEALEHPILEKVKKLLALASSAETHESAAALSAAERLLTKHNLEMPLRDDIEDSPYERWILRFKKKLVFRQNTISWILSEFFFVNTVITHEYDLEKDKTSDVLEIIGKPVNLAMAEYVCHFLEERCDTLWEAYKPTAKKDGETGVRARNAFMSNLLRAFRLKLKRERDLSRENSSGGRVVKDSSLILSLKEDRDRFVRSCYPRLSSVGVRSVGAGAPGSAKAGRKAGERLTLHAPVGNKNSGGIQGRLPRGK